MQQVPLFPRVHKRGVHARKSHTTRVLPSGDGKAQQLQIQSSNIEGLNVSAAGEDEGALERPLEGKPDSDSGQVGGSAPSLLTGPLGADAASVAGPEPSDTALKDITPELSTPDWLRAALLPALLPADDAAMKDEGMLDRGIVSAGAGARTRLLLRKLAAGKEVPLIQVTLKVYRVYQMAELSQECQLCPGPCSDKSPCELTCVLR